MKPHFSLQQRVEQSYKETLKKDINKVMNYNTNTDKYKLVPFKTICHVYQILKNNKLEKTGICGGEFDCRKRCLELGYNLIN